MKPIIVGGVVATLAAVGVVVASPDNLVKNRVEGIIYQDVPGSLDPICDSDPLGTRIAVVEIHGLNTEVKHPDGMSLGSAVAQFAYLNDGWDKNFPEWYGCEFKEKFKRYVWRYNCNDDVYENARRFAKHVEADPELSVGTTKIVLLGHSMGGLVAVDYRDYTNDRKYLGLLTLGTPFHGSPLADPSNVRDGFVDLYHAMIGNKLADKAMKGINFFTAGLQWLKPNNPKMQPVLQRVPLDENCYLFVGKVDHPKLSIMDKAWYTGSLLDIMFIGKNPAQQMDVGYKLGAGLVYAITGEENDGVVPVSSASAKGFNQNCHVVELSSNHSQLAKGAQGDLAIVRYTADALMAIYNNNAYATNQPEDVVVLDPDLRDLQGLVTKADLRSAQLVWVRDGKLVVSSGRNDPGVAVSLPGQYAWPCWDQDNVVATRIDKGSNVVRVTTRGVQCLTQDGKSRLASADEDGNIVYCSGDRLVVYKTGPRMLVKSGVKIDAPPAIVDGVVYFAQKSGKTYSVYRVSVNSKPVSLADTELVVAGLPQPPFLVKSQLMYIQPSEDGQAVQWVPIGKWWQKAELPSNVVLLLSQDLFSNLRQVAVSSNGDCYVVEGSTIRWVDRSQMPNPGQLLGKQVGALVQGKEKAEIQVPGPDVLAPVLAEGVQLDAK